MNKAEAREILAKELLHFHARNYENILKLMGSPEAVSTRTLQSKAELMDSDNPPRRSS